MHATMFSLLSKSEHTSRVVPQPSPKSIKRGGAALPIGCDDDGYGHVRHRGTRNDRGPKNRRCPKRGLATCRFAFRAPGCPHLQHHAKFSATANATASVTTSATAGCCGSPTVRACNMRCRACNMRCAWPLSSGAVGSCGGAAADCAPQHPIAHIMPMAAWNAGALNSILGGCAEW